MAPTPVDGVLKLIEELKRNPRLLTLPMQDQIQELQMELRFLKMFFWCFVTWPWMNLGFSVHGFKYKLLDSSRRIFLEDTGSAVSTLLEFFELSKPMIRAKCISLLDCAYPISFVNTGDIVEFLDLILRNLNHVINSKVNMIFRVKKQIKALEEKTRFFRDVADFMSKRCGRREKLADLFTHIQAWANIVACLSFLYWVDHIDEKTPDVIEIYFRVRKGSKSLRSDTLLMGELLARFVSRFLENLAASKRDHIEILREGFHFLITFLLDPPEEHSKDGKLIETPTDATVSEATSIICSLYVLKTKEDTTKERDILLSNFMKKIDTLKSAVNRFYVQVPKILQSNFPMTNAMGFIKSLAVNLKERLKWKVNFVPFANHQVVTVQGQLESLQLFLEDTMELLNEHKEIKDLWMRIVNVAYQVEHVIDSCSLLKDRPIWYSIICLSNVIDEIKLIKLEVEKITDQEMYNIRNVTKKKDLIHKLPAPTSSSRINQVVVGFKEETQYIIDRLTRGTTQIEIVPIVGMPGQGKTTLAKKVYNDSSIQYHFHKFAWCCVSQVYERKRLLLDILSDVSAVDLAIGTMSVQDLAERLWKSLKGQWFLIVIDDIWDIKAWHELNESFPDDKNGSRIMLTSRIHNLALQVKPDSSPLHLCPLSEQESWELLTEKLNLKDDCSSDLLEVGKQIVKFCKGLPLVIVVLAGLLPRMTQNMVDGWNQIVENLGEQLASEGCMDVLELSYKHLPEHLKPCFLYFGAFPEDRVIAVQKLIKMWIAEGFIQRTNQKSLEDVAKEYLIDLVDRSLAIVAERSSKGGIKACYVHDLFHDLCLAKAKEEYFLRQVYGYDGYDVSQFSLNPIKYDCYRLCIYTDWQSFIESKPTGPRVRSLLLFSPSILYFGDDHVASSLLYNFKHLNVLKLETQHYGFKYFPEAIKMLTLLRYLEICGHFDRVPSSIVNLQNLETFVVQSALDLELPDTIWMMKSLRHVDVKYHFFFSFGRRVCLSSAPLSNIETLSSVEISGESYAMDLFEKLPRLRRLSCCLEKSDSVESYFRFGTFNCLSKLESLKIVHGIKPYAVRFKEITFPKTLRKLTLLGLELPRQAISVIGRLPNLEILKLRKNRIDKNDWYMENEQFLNLKFLELIDMWIKKWRVSTETFPCLEWLVLRDCNRLEGIPSCFGEISTLKMIEVSKCSRQATSSAIEILNEQRDMGNQELQVHIVD